MTFPKFTKDTEVGRALLEWHTQLKEQRGDRAALRRATNTLDAAMVLATHRLIHAFKAADNTINDYYVPDMASVLAHIEKADDSQPLPKQLAAKHQSSDRPIFSPLRFRRLLQAEDVPALCTALRRAIGLLKGHADIYSVANAIYYWNDKTKRHWSLAYFESVTTQQST